MSDWLGLYDTQSSRVYFYSPKSKSTRWLKPENEPISYSPAAKAALSASPRTPVTTLLETLPLIPSPSTSSIYSGKILETLNEAFSASPDDISSAFTLATIQLPLLSTSDLRSVAKNILPKILSLLSSSSSLSLSCLHRILLFCLSLLELLLPYTKHAQNSQLIGQNCLLNSFKEASNNVVICFDLAKIIKVIVQSIKFDCVYELFFDGLHFDAILFEKFSENFESTVDCSSRVYSRFAQKSKIRTSKLSDDFDLSPLIDQSNVDDVSGSLLFHSMTTCLISSFGSSTFSIISEIFKEISIIGSKFWTGSEFSRHLIEIFDCELDYLPIKKSQLIEALITVFENRAHSINQNDLFHSLHITSWLLKYQKGQLTSIDQSLFPPQSPCFNSPNSPIRPSSRCFSSFSPLFSLSPRSFEVVSTHSAHSFVIQLSCTTSMGLLPVSDTFVLVPPDQNRSLISSKITEILGSKFSTPVQIFENFGGCNPLTNFPAPLFFGTFCLGMCPFTNSASGIDSKSLVIFTPSKTKFNYKLPHYVADSKVPVPVPLVPVNRILLTRGTNSTLIGKNDWLSSTDCTFLVPVFFETKHSIGANLELFTHLNKRLAKITTIYDPSIFDEVVDYLLSPASDFVDSCVGLRSAFNALKLGREWRIGLRKSFRQFRKQSWIRLCNQAKKEGVESPIKPRDDEDPDINEFETILWDDINKLEEEVGKFVEVVLKNEKYVEIIRSCGFDGV
ncbi:hypothetical protein RCL1_002919 [Eukaryota sp. TZLM3-RCL]